MLGSEVGAQVESRNKPLVGITAEMKSTGEDVITILLGGRPNDHLAHIIHAPVRVSLKETAEGVHEALHIESKHGPATLLRFRSPMLPELVDGVMLER